MKKMEDLTKLVQISNRRVFNVTMQTRMKWSKPEAFGAPGGPGPPGSCPVRQGRITKL